MANQVDYRDPTPNNFPQDYDPAKVDPRVKLRSDSIKHKQKGIHTREAMYQALEIGSVAGTEALVSSGDTKQKMQDFEDRYSQQIAGNTDLNEVVDARNDGTQSFGTLRERLNALVIIDSENIVGGDVKSSDLISLEKIKQEIDSKMFNLGFITDTHDDKLSSDSGKPTNYSLQHLSNILFLDGKLDAIVAGGDNIDGFSDSYDGLISEHKKFTNKLMLTSLNQSDKFILLGNHDDGALRYINWLQTDMKKPMPKVIPLNKLSEMIGADDVAFDEQRDYNSPYFYKDYANKKVRLIGLNSVDTPDDAVDDHGGPKYPRQNNMGYRQQQLNWLANTALQNVPEGYVTLIVSHIQGDAISDSAKYYNQDVVSEIINSFRNGTKVNIVRDVEDWKVNVNVDFSSQGKRDFGAYIHGHQHKEVANVVNGYNNIGVTCSLSPMESLGTPQEDAWNIITVDTVNRKIVLKGFGRATNREFNY